MKRKGHKHKESFSILMISNTGQRSKQLHISRAVLKVLVAFVVLIVAADGLMGWMVYNSYSKGSEEESLRAQLAASQELVRQLEEEKLTLGAENTALRQENESIANASAETETESDTDTDEDIPRRYPASGRSTVVASYSEEMPYLSINVNMGGIIVAAGSGTVIQVTSDDTYPVIIEIEHDKGYRTRYMCHQATEVSATEGAQVESGDTLFTIMADDTQLDYQITYDGNPIDPLTVIEAKG